MGRGNWAMTSLCHHNSLRSLSLDLCMKGMQRQHFQNPTPGKAEAKAMSPRKAKVQGALGAASHHVGIT